MIGLNVDRVHAFHVHDHEIGCALPIVSSIASSPEESARLGEQSSERHPPPLVPSR